MSWRLENQNLLMCIVKTSSQKGATIKSYDEGFQQVSNCYIIFLKINLFNKQILYFKSLILTSSMYVNL